MTNETSILVACIVLLFMLSKCQSSSREGFDVSDDFRKEVGQLSIGKLQTLLRKERNKTKNQRDVQKIRYLSNLIRHERALDKFPTMSKDLLKQEKQNLESWFNNRKRKDKDIEMFKQIQLKTVSVLLQGDVGTNPPPGTNPPSGINPSDPSFGSDMIPKYIVGSYVEGVRRYKKNVLHDTYNTGIKPLMTQAGNFANCLTQSNPTTEKQAYDEIAKCVNKMDRNVVYNGANELQRRVNSNMGNAQFKMEPIPAFNLTGADIATEFGGLSLS